MKSSGLFLFTFAALLGLCMFFVSIDAKAPTSLNATKVTVYFFWGEGCSHCAKAKPFLHELSQRYPQIEIKMFEVWHNPENLRLMKAMGNDYGFDPKAVPVTFIGKQYFEGFNDVFANKIETAIKEQLKNNDSNNVLDVVPKEKSQSLPASSKPVSEPLTQDIIYLPFIGEVNLSGQSLFVSTLLISFIDGFNPCSIWVLTMLLAITLHSGSRKNIIIIGFVYIFITGLIYALFMIGLFTVFSIVSYLVWIQSAIALMALLFAIVNIKDYFWYQEGLSFTIADENKPLVYKGIQKVMNAGESTWGMIGATIVLAAGVSMIEFSCTAGFPVVWSSLLIAQNTTPEVFILLLLIYMLIYQLDELVLFLVSVFFLKAARITEKHGRILKLIGGMVMLTLALIMLFKPELINKLSSSLIVFGIAGGATLIVLFLHRVVLPKLGIHIGSEKKTNPDKL